jgi:hypothetical protein
MGANDQDGDIADFYGAQMYWSHYDAATNLAMLKECGFAVIWARTVVDPTDPRAAHLFVLAQKGSD